MYMHRYVPVAREKLGGGNHVNLMQAKGVNLNMWHSHNDAILGIVACTVIAITVVQDSDLKTQCSNNLCNCTTRQF